MYENLRTGVIGVGSMVQNHARIYSEISNLVAVADPDAEQGRKVADKFGIKWYEDYNQMLEYIDAVTIAVPTILHRTVAEAAIARGVHVLVEKPLAGNTEDAKAIVEAAKNASLVLAVGHVERHNEVVSKTKDLISKGKIGEILTLSAMRFSSYPFRIRDVGVLFDLAIHDVDLLLYLANSDIKMVFAAGGKSKNDIHEDHINLQLIFEDGKIGFCETNWLTPMKVRQLNITTTSCYLNVDHITQQIKILSSTYDEVDESNLYKTPMQVTEKNISVKAKEPLYNELVEFLSSIEENTEPLISGSDGLKAVRIVEAALKSLNEKSVVRL